jgi:hypothetical protein
VLEDIIFYNESKNSFILRVLNGAFK